MTATARKENVESMLVELAELRREYLNLVAAKKGRMVISPAATEKAIAAREKEQGFAFPPSYRRFLLWCNGWLGMWGSWSVLGLGGNVTARMEKDVKKRLKLFDVAIEHAAAYDDTDPKSALQREREKDLRAKRASYAPHHPVIATNFNGGLIVLDRHRPGKDGEFALTSFHYNEVGSGFKSFGELLRSAVADTRNDIAETRQPGKRGRR